MGRLTNLPARIAALPPRLTRQTDAHGHSKASEPWRKWYATAEWQALRLATFVRDGFTCQMVGCGELIAERGQLVCDHRKRHRGDRALFFDPDNLQTLCKPCHDTKKQREERAARG